METIKLRKSELLRLSAEGSVLVVRRGPMPSNRFHVGQRVRVSPTATAVVDTAAWCPTKRVADSVLSTDTQIPKGGASCVRLRIH